MATKTNETKEEKKEQFRSHHLIDWVLLVVALLVILGGAGYYLYSVYDQTSLELGDTYRSDVVISEKTTNNPLPVTATKNNDVKELDGAMSAADPNSFSDSNLDNASLGM